ncbi:MAG: thioredoxin [Methylococcaceae bacterium]|nr:thioredoxin [Prolixibacteraceae bacterium]
MDNHLKLPTDKRNNDVHRILGLEARCILAHGFAMEYIKTIYSMKANFNSIINDTKPVIVDFHALWCGPCKVQSPILQEIAGEMGERIRVIKIDVDQNQEIANRYQIRSVPTLMIFKNGEIKYKQAGVHTKQQLMGVLQGM